MTLLHIVEAFGLEGANVNADLRTVRQRIIVAGESRNKRVYTPEVLLTALPLFEGCQTYNDHPSKQEMINRPERSIRDVTGWITDVQMENGALWGTRHFASNTAGNDAWALVKDVVEGRAPTSLVGASINYMGKGKTQKDGKVLIEAITQVISVDDVTIPAAGGGWMRESDTTSQDLGAWLTYEEWVSLNPAYAGRYKKEVQTLKRDEVVTEAQALANQHATRLQESQQQIEQLTEAITAKEQALAELQRQIALSDVLAKTPLPQAWKESLRNQLMRSEPSEWQNIIAGEISKSRSLSPNRVPVHGADQQVNEGLTGRSMSPMRGETAEEYFQRIGRK